MKNMVTTESLLKKILNNESPKKVFKEEAGLDMSGKNAQTNMDSINLPEVGQEDLLVSMNDVSQDKKKSILIDYFINIKTYSEKMFDKINNYDLDLIKDDKFELTYEELLTSLEQFTKKVSDYINDLYKGDSYGRALYTYLMFQSELKLIIKLCNKIVSLE